MWPFPGSGFHKASIEQADHRDPTQRVLSKWMGRQVRLECVFQDEMEAEPEAAPPAPKAKEPGQSSKEQVDPSTEEFLRASMETFGEDHFQTQGKLKTR